MAFQIPTVDPAAFGMTPEQGISLNKFMEGWVKQFELMNQQNVQLPGSSGGAHGKCL